MKKLTQLSYVLLFAILSIPLAMNIDTILVFLDKLGILDKTGHFIGFFLLSWFVHKVIKVNLYVSTSTLILYAGFTEIGQGYLSFRSGQFSDFIADTIGCITYSVIVILYRRFK